MKILKAENIVNSKNTQFRSVNNGSTIISSDTCKKISEIAPDLNIDIRGNYVGQGRYVSHNLVCRIESSPIKSEYTVINYILRKLKAEHPKQHVCTRVEIERAKGTDMYAVLYAKNKNINAILTQKVKELIEIYKDTVKLRNGKIYQISKSPILKLLLKK